MSTSQAPCPPDRLLALMKSRRVCRTFIAEPVSEEHLRLLTEAARWATSAGNRHLHKFLIVQDAGVIRRVRSVSPGMLATPPTLVAILTDLDAAEREAVQIERDPSNTMDVGTAAMNMMLMAHALGLGTCPVTSFSQSGVATMLDLPPRLIPEWLLLVGHPAPAPRPRRLGASAPKPVTARDLTWWEQPGRHEP